jgi:hypothetical protein
MLRRSQNLAQDAKSLPAIVNHGYFSDYFLAYRLDAGLTDLYKSWDVREREGLPTARTRMRSLVNAFDKFRVDAALTSPETRDNEAGLNVKILPVDGVAALRDLNDGVLTALGWIPERGQVVALTSGEKVIRVPVAFRCDTPTGLLLLAVDAVFATDPATVVADKTAVSGTLLDPVLVGDKPEGRTVLEAAQLIFTADDPPNYLLACSGGSITLLDRDRWGEGVYLAVDLDDAVARNDARAQGELAAIAALFSAEVVNPGNDAQSVLANLADRAANESAGVSKELRHGVRRSVEQLANAVVRDVRYRQKGAWTQIDPDVLTRECLRYLYRIIVLLFAEARPELGILPVDDPDYQAGYSLARLRDVALTELRGDRALSSTHIQQSLAVLFRAVNEGYEPDAVLDLDSRGLSFPGLGSALFADEACPLLDHSRITDETLQQVLTNLCFTQEQRGRSRQSLSYAALGINQLGAVYEGLMAYKGFLATQELFEIDNDGDPDNGSWVIPVNHANEFADRLFLKEEGPDGQPRRARYQEGDFVFRLSGRDRQRSASYYTPEVLTEFTVRHTLDVYWEEHPDLTAAEILRLTVCEPALGSGSFLNETINQLAARYLKAAQHELGETIDADHYQLELQKAKAHFAINQCYGVDLNPTAVELAEVSLWLNCMYPDLRAPDFDGRLCQGNSLIGARRATYGLEQIKAQPWKSAGNEPAVPPTDQPLTGVPLGEVIGIHHFLLPAEGWGAAADAPELKGRGGAMPQPGLAGEWAEAVRAWRSKIHSVPSKVQTDRLVALAHRVETAWAVAARDQAEHLRVHDARIEVWGTQITDLPDPSMASSTRFLDPDGPASRLRMVMDAWCALWMWAPANGTELPTLNEWLDAVELLLGQPNSLETGSMFTPYELADGTLESVQRFGRASVAEVTARHPWLAACRTIAHTQGFFHWELEQAGVFADGGFDVQIGNPPWVRLDWEEPSSLAEYDPWWGVTDLTTTADSIKRSRRREVLAASEASAAVARDRAEIAGLSVLLGADSREPDLRGIRTNLYMVFMTNTWRRAGRSGVVGLLHPEGHFVDPKAGRLRSATYGRLRRHWHFENEGEKLFPDVANSREFGVNIYASQSRPAFLQAVNLQTPLTLDRSLTHDGNGEPPGIQFPEGGWDTRPHAARIVTVNEDVLANWVRLFDEPGTPATESRLLRPLTTADEGALSVFAHQSLRFADSVHFWTSGFNEKEQKDDGTLVWETKVPDRIEQCVLQGPHILNATPMGQQPNPECRNNKDWSPIDLEALPTDFVPRTNYQIRRLPTAPMGRYPFWEGKPYTTRYREAHREFVESGTVRTLQTCIIAPGMSHIGKVDSTFVEDNLSTVRWSGLLTSLPYDFLIKVSGVNGFKKNITDGLPIPPRNSFLDAALLLRTLRLNCLTAAYAPLWIDLFDLAFASDRFVAAIDSTVELGDVSNEWSVATPLRIDYDRWLAMCDIDAIVALLLGLTEGQLIQMYRSQFAVLRKYEYVMVFDGNGRQICNVHHAYGFHQAQWEADLKRTPVRRGEESVGMWDRVQAYRAGDTSVDLGPFIPPFRPADRETAMRRAYRAFSDRSEID